MNIQSKKIRKSSFFQKSLFSHLQKWDFYKSFIIACVWSAKKYFKTHHGQIRWTILSNTPLSAKCTFTRILKISGKNIEKCRRRSDLSEAHFWNIANWDIGDFVHFWQFFWPNIHILAVIELGIDWEVYFRTTNRIKLLSLKNIDIWPSYGQKTMKFGGCTHIWA